MRPLWFIAGAGAGVYVMVKARRAAEALTPDGLHDRVAGLQLGWQLFTDEVRTGMAEKETELRERLALTPDGPAVLPPGSAAGELQAGPEGRDETDGHQ
jgi:hypothetical protein